MFEHKFFDKSIKFDDNSHECVKFIAYIMKIFKVCGFLTDLNNLNIKFAFPFKITFPQLEKIFF